MGYEAQLYATSSPLATKNRDTKNRDAKNRAPEPESGGAS